MKTAIWLLRVTSQREAMETITFFVSERFSFQLARTTGRVAQSKMIPCDAGCGYYLRKFSPPMTPPIFALSSSSSSSSSS